VELNNRLDLANACLMTSDSKESFVVGARMRVKEALAVIYELEGIGHGTDRG